MRPPRAISRADADGDLDAVEHVGVVICRKLVDGRADTIVMDAEDVMAVGVRIRGFHGHSVGALAIVLADGRSERVAHILGILATADNVRGGGEAWLEVVRWSNYAMVEAEERGIDKANVDGERRSPDPETKLFLGVTAGNGKPLGLDEAWARDIVRPVGDYGESFERNLGQRSPLKLPRGLNALWNKGGQMYPPPMR